MKVKQLLHISKTNFAGVIAQMQLNGVRLSAMYVLFSSRTFFFFQIEDFFNAIFLLVRFFSVQYAQSLAVMSVIGYVIGLGTFQSNFFSQYFFCILLILLFFFQYFYSIQKMFNPIFSSYFPFPFIFLQKKNQIKCRVFTNLNSALPCVTC